MFYSHEVLTRRGALGAVWMAATMGVSRVPRRYAATAQIGRLCASIRAPAAPFALRLSASLLLGVTRVFARKSDLVLADSQGLLVRLRRAETNIAIVSRKRAADDGGFDMITLPTKKRRRKSGSDFGKDDQLRAGNTLTELEAESPAKLWGGSPDVFDLTGAMEMAFPTMDVQNELGEAHEGRRGGNEDSRTLRNSEFRARDQDITIQESGQDFFHHDIEFGVLPHGGPSSSEDMNSGNLLLSDGSGNIRARLNLSGGSGSSPLFGTPLAGTVDIEDFLTFPSPGGAERAVENVQHRSTPNVAASRIHDQGVILQEDEVNAGVQDNNVLRTNSDLPVAHVLGLPKEAAFETPDLARRLEDRLPTGEQEEARPVELMDLGDDVQAKDCRLATKEGGNGLLVSSARPPRLPRSRQRVKYDTLTELTMAHIRRTMSTGTETCHTGSIMQKSRKRVRKVKQSDIAQAFFANPLFGSTVASELGNMWATLVAGPELDALTSYDTLLARDARQSSKTLSKDDKDLGNSLGSGRVSSSDPSPAGYIPPADGDEGNLIPSDELPLLEHGEPSLVDTERRSKSIAVPGKDSRVAQPEGPHVAVTVMNSPLRYGADLRESIPATDDDDEPERLRRDSLFEKITESDRAAFNVARRLEFEDAVLDGGPSAQRNGASSIRGSLRSHMSRDSAAADMPSAIGRSLFSDTEEDKSQPDDGDSNKLLLPASVPASQWPLEEETEQVEESVKERGPPMTGIEIETFKVLDILRTDFNEAVKLRPDRQASSEFDHLARKCSRSTTAKLFYHVLALCTNGIVCVEQASAYGAIKLQPGKFY